MLTIDAIRRFASISQRRRHIKENNHLHICLNSSVSGDNADICLDPQIAAIETSSTRNLDLNNNFEQPQHMSLASMDNPFQKRSNTTLLYSSTVANENDDFYSNPSLDLENMNFTVTDHTQFISQMTALGFDISDNENSTDVRNDVSTESIIENGSNFSHVQADWNFTRHSVKNGDKMRTSSFGQNDLTSSVGTTLVLENLDSEIRDEILNVLFRHRRRITFRIE